MISTPIILHVGGLWEYLENKHQHSDNNTRWKICRKRATVNRCNMLEHLLKMTGRGNRMRRGHDPNCLKVQSHRIYVEMVWLMRKGVESHQDVITQFSRWLVYARIPEVHTLLSWGRSAVTFCYEVNMWSMLWRHDKRTNYCLTPVSLSFSISVCSSPHYEGRYFIWPPTEGASSVFISASAALLKLFGLIRPWQVVLNKLFKMTKHSSIWCSRSVHREHTMLVQSGFCRL